MSPVRCSAWFGGAFPLRRLTLAGDFLRRAPANPFTCHAGYDKRKNKNEHIGERGQLNPHIGIPPGQTSDAILARCPRPTSEKQERGNGIQVLRRSADIVSALDPSWCPKIQPE